MKKPITVTLGDMPLWNSRKNWRNCGGQPNLLRTFHRRPLYKLSLSKALVKSRKRNAKFANHVSIIQEAQLSQRGRAMPRVVEYFRWSLKAALSRRINMVTFANVGSVRLPSLKFVGLRVRKIRRI